MDTTNCLNIFFKKEHIVGFAKYIIVGISAVILDVILMYLFTEILGLWYIFSAAISYILIFLYVFFLNRHWVFKSRKRMFPQLIRFVILVIVNYFLILVMLYFFTEFLNIYYIFSKLFAIAITTLWNFALYKIWVYKD